ncbi:Wzz/FepE/Etk N-terminal domain-containing protein [Chenggangzhangella methanolivorans]|uniref:Polysaccharide chain length determinant N-terminal domain-containing protein n=1 Tax=Chenggangzhangella methanolivorans TaxID=1437009 RepID=A0A9E6RDS5_9HYPH|nr:Wzz/FepE/Etk N-terminal domain-containing protein [Chenggangzhangella methanolivorans]QZO01498.1 hypothetical protein K6K41_08740 [Chenggangzhangella methanolivorans]
MSQPPASMRGVAPPSAEEAIASGVADFAGLARRGVVLIAACAIGCGLLAGAYLSMQTPLFRATAEILVDPAALQVVGKDIVRSDTAASIDFANIDSQALVIVSNSILDQLVDELKLDQDPVFPRRSRPARAPDRRGHRRRAGSRHDPRESEAFDRGAARRRLAGVRRHGVASQRREGRPRSRTASSRSICGRAPKVAARPRGGPTTRCSGSSPTSAGSSATPRPRSKSSAATTA